MNENLIIMIIDSFPSDMNFLRLYEKDNSAKCFFFVWTQFGRSFIEWIISFVKD